MLLKCLPHNVNPIQITPNIKDLTPLRKYFPSFLAHASPPTPPTPEMPEIAPGILTPTESHNASFQATSPALHDHERRKQTRGMAKMNLS